MHPGNNAGIRSATPIFFVPDRGRVLDYYSRLGFSCDYNMGFVGRDGFELILHETEQRSSVVPNHPVHGRDALDAFAMVSDIDALFTELKAKDASFVYELRTNEYRMREFAIIDPAGYTIGFGQSLD